jgi:hypothetical protein
VTSNELWNLVLYLLVGVGFNAVLGSTHSFHHLNEELSTEDVPMLLIPLLAAVARGEGEGALIGMHMA